MSASDETTDMTTSHLTDPAKGTGQVIGYSHSTKQVNDTRQAAGYEVIANYESLSSITSKMRDAAVHGEWGQLIVLEQQCSRHVAAMKPADAEAKLDELARQRKIELIKKILADDAEIRNRTEMWTGQLQRIMQSNRQEQRLQQAYGI
jgi:flagellar protein FliT